MTETKGNVFDIEDKPGVWFDMDGGGRVKLKNIGIDEYLDILDKTTKKVPFVKEVDGKQRVFTYEEENERLRAILANDVAIQDWENLLDKNGKPIPCTKENKTLLMIKSSVFRDFCNEKLKILAEAEAEHEKAAEKN